MKLKLKYDEVDAIRRVLELTCAMMDMQRRDGFLEPDDKLRMFLLLDMKLHFQHKALDKQTKYNITIKREWAMAFHIQLAGFGDRRTFEGNITQQLCDKVDQSIMCLI